MDYAFAAKSQKILNYLIDIQPQQQYRPPAQVPPAPVHDPEVDTVTKADSDISELSVTEMRDTLKRSGSIPNDTSEGISFNLY